MGYTSAGGVKGLGVFNNTPSTRADLNQLLSLIAAVGNVRQGDQSDRDALTGAKLYRGLMFSYTDQTRVDIYDGAGWALLWSDSDWQDLDLMSGWTVVAGDNPQYRVMSGELRFRGRLNASAGAGEIPFTTKLPASARPDRAVPQLIGVTGGAGSMFVMNVATDGEVRVFKGGNPVGGLALAGFVPFLLV